MIHDLSKARDPIDRAELHRQLDRLLDLRERTDPAVCNDPASVSFGQITGKDSAAFAAVGLMEFFTASVVGWAINQRIGCVLAGPEVEPNSHQSEAIGQEAASPGGNGRLDDPTQARRVLLSVLNHRAMPFNISVDIRDALEALEFGEVAPILKPNTRGLHGQAYTLAKLRMNAVVYSHYLIGKGVSQANAYKRVASVIGVSDFTIKSWRERDVPAVLGKSVIEAHIEEGKKAGSFFEEIRHDATRRSLILNGPVTMEWLVLTHAQHLEDFNLRQLEREIKIAQNKG